MALFAPEPHRTNRRPVRRLTAIAFALVLALGFAASPARAAGTVQLAMTVSPTIGGPSTPELNWTITVTPVGGPATAFTVHFTTDNSQGRVDCTPDCLGRSGNSATWFIPVMTGPVNLVATTGYRGSGNVTSTVSASGFGTSCSNCPRTATVVGPAGSFTVQASPANPLPGSNVHVVISTTMNQPLDIFVLSRLPAGLGPPTNASPAGSWNSGKNQMSWEIGEVASQVITYDALVTAGPGSVLTIESAFGSNALPTQQQTVSVQVGTPPATPTPAPTTRPTPGATPNATATPNPTADTGQGSGPSPNPSGPGKLTNQSPAPSPGSSVGGIAGSPGGSPPSSTDPASPEAAAAGSVRFPADREGTPLGLLAVLATGAIGLLGFGAFMVYRNPDSGP